MSLSSAVEIGVTGWFDSVLLFDSTTCELVDSVPTGLGKSCRVRAYAGSSDGSIGPLLVVSEYVILGMSSSSVHVVDPLTKVNINVIRGHRGGVFGLCLVPSPVPLVASGDHSGRVFLSQISSSTSVRLTPVPRVSKALCATPTHFFAAGNKDYAVHEFDVATQSLVRHYPSLHTDGVWGIASTSAAPTWGDVVITGSYDSTTRVWSRNAGRSVLTISVEKPFLSYDILTTKLILSLTSLGNSFSISITLALSTLVTGHFTSNLKESRHQLNNKKKRSPLTEIDTVHGLSLSNCFGCLQSATSSEPLTIEVLFLLEPYPEREIYFHRLDSLSERFNHPGSGEIEGDLLIYNPITLQTIPQLPEEEEEEEREEHIIFNPTEGLRLRVRCVYLNGWIQQGEDWIFSDLMWSRETWYGLENAPKVTVVLPDVSYEFQEEKEEEGE